MPEKVPEESGFSKSVPLARVQQLTDTLFALSMIVILLQIDYPDPSVVVTDEQILDFLATQRPAIHVFAITFVLIAIYWVKHMEHFGYIRSINYRLLWLQLGFLLFLIMMPVMNAYAVLYPLHQTVFMNYCVVLLGMGFFSAASWRYASKGGRLIDKETSPEVVQSFWADALIEPIAAAAAMGVAFWSVEAGQAALLVIPLAFAAQRWRRKRKRASPRTPPCIDNHG